MMLEEGQGARKGRPQMDAPRVIRRGAQKVCPKRDAQKGCPKGVAKRVDQKVWPKGVPKRGPKRGAQKGCSKKGCSKGVQLREKAAWREGRSGGGGRPFGERPLGRKASRGEGQR